MDTKRFRVWAAGIVLFYLTVSSIYAIRVPRIADEYGNAQAILTIVRRIPYVDYCPPKTLLGYYFFAPPLLLIGDAWNALTAAKLQLVLVTGTMILAAAFALRRLADDRAILASLALFVVMSTYLERSMELRNDAVSSLFGFASLLCLARGRAFWAGVLCGLSFLSTQKGIYFVAAAEAAVVAVWLRDRTMQTFRQLAALNLGGAATALGYWAFWAIVASPGSIIQCTFLEEGVIAYALQEMYDIRGKYWTQTLLRNPFFYALAGASLLILAARWLRARGDHAVAVLVPYAFVVTAAAIWHKQPWPYFFINLIPTLFVVNALGLTEILAWLRQRTIAMRVFLAAFVLLGIALPLLRLPGRLARDAGHQKATFRLGERLLAPGEKYIDGAGMLYRHENAAAVLAWVDKPTHDYLKTLKPGEIDAIVEQIDRAPAKLLIINYRTISLPPRLLAALGHRFVPLFGNIFLYGPIVETPSFTVAFDGTYVVESDRPVIIDGATVAPRSTIALRKGRHSLGGAPAIRLRLLPPPDIEVDRAFQKPRDLYHGAYD